MIRRRAFTLVEVLLALGLVAMLAGSIFGFMWNIVRVRDAMAAESRDVQAGAAVVERIESDVLCGLAGDANVGAGVSGTATSLKVMTRGVAVPVGSEVDQGDLQWSEFSFDRAAGTIKARRGKARGTAELELVSDHLQWARLRYFDGKVWAESFDSLKSGGLPVAIEVALWFGPVWHAAGASEPTSPEPAIPGEEPREARGGSESSSTPEGPTREPDRLRIVVMPDGPVASWKEGS